MKYFFVILGLGLVGGGFFYYITENEKAAAAEAYQRELAERAREEERQAKQKIEDERIRKERMANLAKEDAVRLLQKYIAKQEDQLKSTVEECQIKIKMIEVDQASLSDELVALEKEEEAKAKDAVRRKVKRRDKNDRVDALLASPTLNRLAQTYTGEDLSAMRAEFRSRMGNMIKIHDDGAKKLAENRKKYRDAMIAADAEVDAKTKAASERLSFARREIEQGIPQLEKRLAELENKLNKLEEKDLKAKAGGVKLTPWERDDLKRYQSERDVVMEQLASRKATAGLGTANAEHMQVTIAETSARRKSDIAIVEKEESDVQVLKDMSFEGDVFNLAVNYENRSLDRVRNAIMTARDQWCEKLDVAKKKLEFLSSSSGNMDFLNADEVERVRKRIAGKIADDSFWVEE